MGNERTNPTEPRMEPVSEMEMDGTHWSGFLGTFPRCWAAQSIAIGSNPVQSTQGELPRFGGGGNLKSIHRITSAFSIRVLAAAEEWRESGRLLDDCNGMDASDEVMACRDLS